MTSTTIRRTPLYDSMLKAGGRMVDFHGWELPVQFSGIIQEHRAVRNDCGIFDVSHMGQVFVTGKDAHAFVQKVNANDIKDIAGRGAYSHVLNERGGLVDDVIPFCLSKERFFIVVNSATTEKDYNWFVKQSAGMDLKIENASDRFGMIALQGPKAPQLMAELWPDSVKLARFWIMETKIHGEQGFICRTGYTGEDGCEIIASPAATVKVWDELLEKGRKYGLIPCGLGSRDTLRLESGYLLYGSDVDDDHNSFEANYGWVVKPKKGDFIGKEAALKSKAAGIKRKLTGFALTQGGVPRPGCAIYLQGQKIGELCSATFSPVLGKGIGVGYAAPPDLKEGEPVEIEIHGRRIPAKVNRVPFYENKV
ncbi:MAG: glycine cleavage system aminomethyltransferase GcvT [Elusimicrobiales bacterium]|nr:glycine cleavage system aminomethyltransferase GcvT [Elusimicrobiales bacterium]